ncbi:MAG: hypothetical protein HY908_21905, partial [Myxococcales bacterium]|nr:hypothetical protein [Myxococcales bacterium]
MSSAGPLIRAEALTVHADGRPVLEGLDLETRGDRVVLTGSAGVFVATLMGFAQGTSDAAAGPPRVASGSLRLAGRDVAQGAHLASLGVAPFEPPLPAGDTVRELVARGARLAGVAGPCPVRGRAARLAATAVLERLGARHLAAR